MRALPSLLALLVSLVLFALATRQPMAAGFDASWHVLAAAQFGRGDSPSPGQVVMAAEDDLSQDRASWLYWYAPGIGFALAPLASAGVPLGDALRLVTGAAVALGSVGWLRWWAAFGLPLWLKALGGLLLPLGWYAGGGLAQYVPEVLVFALAPWTLLLVRWLAERPSGSAGWVIAGLALGGLYLLKYTAAFVGLSVLLWLAWEAWRLRSRPAWARVAALGGGLAVAPLLLSLVARQAGAPANLVTAGGLTLPGWEVLALGLTGLPLVASGLDVLGRALAEGWGLPYVSIAVAGLPGLAWLVWGWARAERGSVAARLAMALAVGHVALFLAASFSSSVSMEPRHLLVGALAALPLALSGSWRSSPRLQAGLGMVALLAPAALSAFAVVARLAGPPAPCVSEPSHLGIRSLGGASPRAVLAVVPLAEPQDVWFLADPNVAVDLSQRVLINGTVWFPGANLPGYRTSRLVNVHAVLPWELEVSGTAERIRASFVGAGQWQVSDVPGCGCQVWTARVEPT